MAGHGNFTSVTLRVNPDRSQQLVIEGATDKPQEVKEIYVGLAHGKRQLSVSANGAVGLPPAGKERELVKAVAGAGATWKATIEKPSPRLSIGEQVLVVGVAMLKARGEPPVFWHQTCTADRPDAAHR
jgi:hypothetical protein